MIVYKTHTHIYIHTPDTYDSVFFKSWPHVVVYRRWNGGSILSWESSLKVDCLPQLHVARIGKRKSCTGTLEPSVPGCFYTTVSWWVFSSQADGGRVLKLLWVKFQPTPCDMWRLFSVNMIWISPSIADAFLSVSGNGISAIIYGLHVKCGLSASHDAWIAHSDIPETKMEMESDSQIH